MHVIHKTNLCVLDIAYKLEASEPPHHFIYMDEAGFSLTKRTRSGRNIISHRATVDVPGQRGGNITMGAAISENVYSHYWANTIQSVLSPF